MLHCDVLSSNEVMKFARLDKVHVMNVNYFTFLLCHGGPWRIFFTYTHSTQWLGIAFNYSFCLLFVLKNK